MGWLRASLVVGCVLIGCASEEASDATSCVPGAQVVCDCPGNAKGFQVCDATGNSYGECTGCSSGTGGGSGSGGFPTTGGSGGMVTGGAGGASSGGTGGTSTGGTGGGAGPVYTSADCLITANNDEEVCDDAQAEVPVTGALVLVCLTANGGKTYISKNTGPVMFDGISRCQGWEDNGQNAWDHLQYIYTLDCTTAQATLDVDLSSYVGQTIWVGVHDQPTGGGDNTPVCVAVKK
jgi:hypothetical protein